MSAGAKHYFKDGKEYKGATHKDGGKLMSGAKHTAASKDLMHTKGKIKSKRPATPSKQTKGY